MKATDVLKEEHQTIKRMLHILDAMCKKLSKNEIVPKEHLKNVVAFIQIFADKCHHGKEEDLLFPAMEKAGISRQGGPIGVMLQEHDLGRAHVQGMQKALEKEEFNSFIESATGYIELLEAHIEKEDYILYMMADMALSEETQNQLVQEFEKMEEERIGRGKHEEFHKMLYDLEKIYLSQRSE